MTDYYQLIENNRPEAIDKAQRRIAKAQAMPDPLLRQKALAAMSDTAIVHRPSRKVSGELHKMGPEEDVPKGIPNGEPWGASVIGKHLVKFDQNGKAAQAYPLGDNHHVVIWERATPNSKGELDRIAEVVPTIEAARRKNHGEPIIRKSRPEPGWRFVMALCKGDMVEMEDGNIVILGSISTTGSGAGDLTFWHTFVANKGKNEERNPYRYERITGRAELQLLVNRVVLSPTGEIVYREGPVV